MSANSRSGVVGDDVVRLLALREQAQNEFHGDAHTANDRLPAKYSWISSDAVQ